MKTNNNKLYVPFSLAMLPSVGSLHIRYHPKSFATTAYLKNSMTESSHENNFSSTLSGKDNKQLYKKNVDERLFDV